VARQKTKAVCVLADALQGHGIDTTILEFVTIAEIGGTPSAGTEQTEFAVTLENVGEAGMQTEHLLIEWQGIKALHGEPPMQGRPMTEWAACGIACALLRHYTDFWIRSTARYGEGFDYWVTNGKRQQGLEVSGTQSQDADEMQERHREKRRQLFSEEQVGGYVVVVGFARREIIVSYHEAEE
jgi:hypothetical protein